MTRREKLGWTILSSPVVIVLGAAVHSAYASAGPLAALLLTFSIASVIFGGYLITTGGKR